MSKFSSPLRFSRAFGVDPQALRRMGAFDPVLATDTHLFIDPLTLSHSRVREVRENSFDRIHNFFDQIYRLLRQSRQPNDIWEQTAFSQWPRRELGGTCLGYGGGSIRGTATAQEKIHSTLERASEIIRGGVNDPGLFLLIGLFQPGIGSDTISDLVTHLILPDLSAYTSRICDRFGIPTEKFEINGVAHLLPSNPTQTKRTPVILIPFDILRELPVALSYSEIWDVAAQNAALRNSLNREISSTWEKTTKEQKQQILEKLIDSADSVRRLIEAMRGTNPSTYDIHRDPRGMLLWADLAYELGEKYPHQIEQPARKTLTTLNGVVEAIISQFQFLMEQRDLWKVMQLVPSRQLEKVAQTLFFATAYAYIQSNNIDITPEADTGNGPVDFKFSTGLSSRILVELKLSKNDVLKGYRTQLKTYMNAEESKQAHYVVIDLGRLGRKWETLQDLNRQDIESGQSIRLWRVDGTKKESASKRKASVPTSDKKSEQR